ncbi:hypothetical protein [Ligaoa zhengdingensis]|jgi:hypothetical protein|uniref:hypothetical protein n=1 Tax=Ligaoa zhengdingensis TaxID=2763658 RepID=UPI002045C6D8|nr:MAG TPA: protein of unknown function (DUF5047) [Caudoviricetes sp.]
MLSVSTEFMEAVRAPQRDWIASVSFGVYDVTAKADAAASSTGRQPFSRERYTLDTVADMTNIGTCEQDQFRLNGTFSLFPDQPDTVNWGWWSANMSDENGTFSENPKIVCTFTRPHSSIGATLTFAEPIMDVRAEMYSGDTLLNAADFTGLNTVKAVLNLPAENYNRVVVEFKRALPYHYVKLLEIDFGIEYIYGNENVTSIDVLEEIDLTGNSISSNSMTITLNNRDQRFNMFNPQNEVRFLQERQQLQVNVGLHVGDTYETVPLGIYYLSEWGSPTQNTTKFTAYDLISQLDGVYYKSRLYDGERAETVFTELFDDLRMYDAQGKPRFYVHPNIRDVPISGYIEPMEYRDALQRIAFACGAVVKTNRMGQLVVYRATDEIGNQIIIDEYTTYEKTPVCGGMSAGQGIVLAADIYTIPAPIVIDRSLSQAPRASVGKYYNQVNVEQYRWRSKGETETLFEGALSGDVLIPFQSYPAQNITVTGDYTSFEPYACAVIVRGASGEIVVTGNVLEPQTRIVSTQLPDVAENVKPNTLEVKGVTLIAREDTARYVSAWLLEEMQNRITQTFNWWMNPAVETADFCKLETQFGELRESQIRKMHFKYQSGLSGDSEVIG